MDPPRYDGTIHPDEWIKQVRIFCYFKQITDEQEIVKFCKSMINSTINIKNYFEEINTFTSLSNALRSHVTFKILKDSCKRKLQSLKFIPEIHGGDTAKFISYFNKKCFDAEINDLGEQKKLLFYSLSDDFLRKEFNKRIHDVKSKEILLQSFNDIVNEYSRLIKYGSWVTIRHVSTVKYLATCSEKYLTGSRGQIIFGTNTLPETNATWKLNYPFGHQAKTDKEQLVLYGDTISLQNQFAGNMLWAYPNYKSPTSGHVEVSCYSMNQYNNWIIRPSAVSKKPKENAKRYLKSEDKVIIENENNEKVMILHSHDIKYTLAQGGETSKFINTFRQLCYNADINDIEEQKEYFKQTLSSNFYLYDEFSKRKVKISSINELIKEFEEIAMEESNIIRNGSIVALKHVATGKYLSSIKGLNYTTGSKNQLIFANNLLDSNALWKITFSGKELSSYTDTNIYLQHKKSNIFLGIYNEVYKSPVTQHTEVSCNPNNNIQWKFDNSKLENGQGYLKSNDILNIKNVNLSKHFLRSHDFQFTIKNDTFQEVVCHNERLGGNDEWWCIELIE
ncbi:6592_t:CDS:2 [Funneliformis caledonium]|uniref:6592_t:CDS:1 n=1 Tax=Funneliformis caledonium TaxID=1117310 RepID=A0A9N8YLJ7_9GLOM|nr:6592_t:CDS:2 [Funneliformis caledonium]